MALHRSGYRTGYEVAAINSKTNERLYVGIIRGARSRSSLRQVIFGEFEAGKTRLDRVSEITGQKPTAWIWANRAADGAVSGDWTIRFTGRTALEVDQQGRGRSIYDEPVDCPVDDPSCEGSDEQCHDACEPSRAANLTRAPQAQ